MIGATAAFSVVAGYSAVDRGMAADDLASRVESQGEQIRLLESLLVALSRDMTLEEAANVLARTHASEIIKKVDDQTLEVGSVTLIFDAGQLEGVRAW